jgi:hypothetical protein
MATGARPFCPAVVEPAHHARPRGYSGRCAPPGTGGRRVRRSLGTPFTRYSGALRTKSALVRARPPPPPVNPQTPLHAEHEEHLRPARPALLRRDVTLDPRSGRVHDERHIRVERPVCRQVEHPRPGVLDGVLDELPAHRAIVAHTNRCSCGPQHGPRQRRAEPRERQDRARRGWNCRIGSYPLRRHSEPPPWSRSGWR